MQKFLRWILQYNKAFAAFFGVPLITYLAQNLVVVLQDNGIALPPGTDMEIDKAVLWLISLAVSGAVYAIPNKGK